MGQTPLAGRALVEGDDVAGAAPVAVLSHHYWRDEMGGRADAIGKHDADRPGDRHHRRRAQAGHRVWQHRRDRSLVAAAAESGRPARCQELAIHRPVARGRHVRSGRRGNGGDWRRAGERIPADQRRLEAAIGPDSRDHRRRRFLDSDRPVLVLDGLIDRDCDGERLEPDHGPGRGPRARAGGPHRDGREGRAVAQAIPRRGLRPCGDRGAAYQCQWRGRGCSSFRPRSRSFDRL